MLLSATRYEATNRYDDLNQLTLKNYAELKYVIFVLFRNLNLIFWMFLEKIFVITTDFRPYCGRWAGAKAAAIIFISLYGHATNRYNLAHI